MSTRTQRPVRPSTTKKAGPANQESGRRKPVAADTAGNLTMGDEAAAAAHEATTPVAAPKRKRRFYGNSRTDPGPGRGMRMAVLAAVAVAVVVAGAASTQVLAQGGGNSGTIKVHDGTAADPPTRNEPHVEGDAFVEGFGMAADEGTLQIFTWPPTGDKTLVLSTTWAADDGEPEFHFLAGPFELPCGHYRAEAQNGLEEDDFPGGVKSKMFWVECPPAPPCETDCEPEPCEVDCEPEPCETDCEPEPCETDCEPEPCEVDCEPVPVMECPAGLEAVPTEDGSVTLTWTVAAGSDGTNIYRAGAEGDLEYVTTVDANVTSWTDEDAARGAGYAYSVTGLYGNQESEDCPLVEVTAIPDFPTVMAFGLATGGGLLAYAVRRRKA